MTVIGKLKVETGTYLIISNNLLLLFHIGFIIQYATKVVRVFLLFLKHLMYTLYQDVS